MRELAHFIIALLENVPGISLNESRKRAGCTSIHIYTNDVNIVLEYYVALHSFPCYSILQYVAQAYMASSRRVSYVHPDSKTKETKCLVSPRNNCREFHGPTAPFSLRWKEERRKAISTKVQKTTKLKEYKKPTPWSQSRRT